MNEGPTEFSRRRFLGTTGAAALAGVLPAELAAGATRPRGSMDQIEHVVILMQENRSFDHYYGGLRGVRGFGDQSALRLSTGKDAFHQPAFLIRGDGELQPWRLNTTTTDSEAIASTLHDWDTTHFAWNQGKYDSWVPWKGQASLGYFTREDIPFHYALADAFTICDAYHCSIQGPTIPNRLYHWTGTIDPGGQLGGPATYNPHEYQPSYSWTTYPERLQSAGISWQVYANDEVGSSGDHPYVGDYGDNPLWLFHAYHEALASTDPAKQELAARAGLHGEWKPDSGHGYEPAHAFAKFIADCASGSLPAVSWVVTPFGYCEHPDARPVDGEVAMQTVLNALWANDKLWPNTVVLINYDENDGLFDHVPPPVPPLGTPDEFLPCIQPLDGSILPFPIPPWAFGPPTPIGLGPRVPMTVVSPWSTGGWVNSQVFDHTSVLRFLEAWTGVRETNISSWRRQVCGDLVSCFDFGTSSTKIPLLPDTLASRAKIDATEKTLPAPSPPDNHEQLPPKQEPGTALARALPYQPNANIVATATSLTLTMSNGGTAAIQLAVYPYHLDGIPAQHTIAANTAVDAHLRCRSTYDVIIHGPNGFLVGARGDAATDLGAVLEVTPGPRLQLTLANHETEDVTLTVSGQQVHLSSGQSRVIVFDPLARDHGWYDIDITNPAKENWSRRYRGHLENGLPSRTEESRAPGNPMATSGSRWPA